MSDESAAPPAPDPIKPPAGPRPPGARPPVRKTAPPPPAKPRSDVKKWLVLGIIISSVLLIAAIGWRVAVLLTKKPTETRNVKGEWENAWQSAVLAHKEMFGLQAKTWVKNEPLTDEEMGKFKAGLATLQKTSEKYHDLMALLREKGKLNSQEANDMNATQVRLKAWIWDANGMTDPASKPPKYGGFYNPMYAAEKRRDEAVKRLKELREKAPEISARKDVAEIEAVVKECRGLIDTFGAIRDELLALDDELLKGLTLPDLKVEQLEELADLRDYQNKAGMGIKEAREVRSLFPDPEDLKPRPETPKPEEPKAEPPKAEEPPKQEPPKETPPKQEPPKEEPPKPEPPKSEESPKQSRVPSLESRALSRVASPEGPYGRLGTGDWERTGDRGPGTGDLHP